MKKFLCVAFALILLAGMPRIFAGAVEEPTAALSIGTDTAYRGDTVAVTVEVNASEVSSIGLIVSCDPDFLTWEGGEWFGIKGMSLPNVFTEYGTASCAFDPATDISDRIITLYFKVKPRAEFELTNIDVQLVINSNGVNYTVNASTSVAIVCKHSFTTELAEADRLKAEATCVSPAEYWKACSICGEVSTTEYFQSGDALGHSFSAWESISDTQHKRACKCGEIEILDHAFDEKGVCTECKFSEAIPGDLDGNESVDIVDAEYLLMYIFYPEFFPVEQPVDFDGNGSVDIRDAEYLLMYIFYPEFFPIA